MIVKVTACLLASIFFLSGNLATLYASSRVNTNFNYTEVISVGNETATLWYDWNDIIKTTHIIHKDGTEEVVVFNNITLDLYINGVLVDITVYEHDRHTPHAASRLMSRTGWTFLRTLPDRSGTINPVGLSAIALTAALGSVKGGPIGSGVGAALGTLVYGNTRTFRFEVTNRREYFNNIGSRGDTGITARIYESGTFWRLSDGRM